MLIPVLHQYWSVESRPVPSPQVSGLQSYGFEYQATYATRFSVGTMPTGVHHMVLTPACEISVQSDSFRIPATPQMVSRTSGCHTFELDTNEH